MKDTLKNALVGAIKEGGDPDWHYQAEEIADELLTTPSGQDIVTEMEQGRKSTSLLRLIVMRHHDSADQIGDCDVCTAAMQTLGWSIAE